MRKLSLVIAGILGAGSPLISQAATLGEAEVQSYLSEPLEVRVPLMRSSDEPLDEITVQLAPPSFYREAGVPLASLRGNLTFAIESERGQEFVRIGSKRPIRDPIVSMLLQVQSPQGRMIRSYNLLLDPPTVASRSAAAPAPAATPEPTASPKASGSAGEPSASSSWQRVEPADNLELDATRKVQRGDTLSQIASDFVGDGQDLRSVMQAIIDANPHAFANGNGNALMAGAELKVPSSSTQADAGQGEGAPAEEPPIQRLPALELLSPSEKEPTAASELGGFGELSRENPLPAIADSTRAETAPMDRESALEQEELESVKAENEALTEQLRSLKEQIDSVKVAIDERDAQIADLKDVVEESRQQAQQLRANQGNFWVEWGKYLTGAMGLLIIALLIALGLRRSRRDETPAVPMPATADAAQEPRPESSAAGAATVATGAAAAATGAIAAGDEDDQPTSQEPSPSEPEPASEDPMNPEMALEEARVLESFNLTHQALELLQESLAEHPGHEGLQTAVNRLSGMEQGGETTEGGEEPASEPAPGDAPSVTPEEEPSQAPSMTEEPIDTDAKRPGEGEAHAETPEPSGEIAWDDDFDDMLATPENEEAPTSDDNLMEFDDSFALETPNEEERSASLDETLDLPENETPPASVETPEKATADEPEPLDLDLSGYQPEESTDEAAGGDEASLEPGMELDQDEESTSTEEPEAETSASASDSDADIDTRVSLAEAFLDVGDRESFDMIESELREEGATAALERLAELKQRHES